MADLSGRTLGEFVLQEEIGQGGYGAVYRAAQPLLKRDVVVKVLRKNGDVAEQRFLREAQLASRFEHPFAAHIYAFGVDEDENLLWIAMELVQGLTLSSWIEQHGPMPLEQFVPFFECVADAVQAAHEGGIVHRDLKPSNVMVVERGGRLLPKLLDFGIAKTVEAIQAKSSEAAPAAEPPQRVATETVRIRSGAQVLRRTVTSPDQGKDYRLTRTGSAFGSRPYMSPEQWHDAQAVGPASDVYSLGVVAYEALTGRLPYVAESSEEWCRLHRHAEFPPIGGGFPRDLNRILACAMAKSPEDRYRGPLEMAAELREALQAQPRERLRALARVWHDSARSPTLLLRGSDLLRTPREIIGDLERAFVVASDRRTARLAWGRRVLVATAVALAVGAVWYRGVLETRSARRVADANATQAALEQGRAALLHNEPGARLHLAEAYRRDPSPATAFMLARALQPREAERAQLTSSFGRMWSAAFSPNGQQIVTTDDKSAQIWDADGYRLRFTLHHGDTVYQAVFAAGGAELVTACGDGVVRIWNTSSGALIRELRPREDHPRYYRIAVSPDHRYIASIDIEGAVTHVWDASTGTLRAELHTETEGDPSVAFSSDGRALATSGGQGVDVYDTESWATTTRIPGPGIRALSWDPSGPRLVTGSANGDAAIWAIPSGSRAHHLRDVGELVDAVAYSPDGHLVAVASHDGTEQVWDAASGKLRSHSNHLQGKILSIEFDPKSALLVAAGSSGTVAISDVAQGMVVALLDGPKNVVLSARFDPSSTRVVGASWDGTARVWDATAPYRRWSSPPLADSCGVVTSLDPDQRFLAIGCKDQRTRVWDTAQGRLLVELPSVVSPGGDFESPYPAVSAMGDRAAIVRGREVQIYSVPGGELLRTIRHDKPVSAVAFARGGRDVVSGAVDGSIIVTRDNGAVLMLPMAAAGIDAVGFLPDGRFVATDAASRLRVFAPDGAALADLKTAARIRTLRVSRDSSRLVTVPSFAGRAATPELWDLQRYQAIAPLADAGQGQVYSARFVGTEQVLTACGDGAIRLWDREGNLRHRYEGSSRFVADATLTSDGAMVIGGGGDGMLRFWDVASERLLWAMPAHQSHLVGVQVDGGDIVTRGFSGDLSHWVLPDPARVIEACGLEGHCDTVSK
jgi:WD40 repeat protein/serine/threonine protein kinase